MQTVRRAAVVALLCALHALPAAARPAASPRVLLRSGDVASDGLGLDSLSAPAAGPTGEIAVQGTTSALLTRAGDAVTVVARTGDALPPPLAGTFDAFSSSAINDGGAIAFTATLNSPAAHTGLFLFDGGTITTIALSERRPDGTIAVPTAPEINNASDIAYRTSIAAVRLWRRASGERIEIATAGDPLPGGGTFTVFMGCRLRDPAGGASG